MDLFFRPALTCSPVASCTYFKKKKHVRFFVTYVLTRWAPTSYKWSYNPYKWPYNWVTGVITLLIEVITPLVTSRGPTLYRFEEFNQVTKIGEKLGEKRVYHRPNPNLVGIHDVKQLGRGLHRNANPCKEFLGFGRVEGNK